MSRFSEVLSVKTAVGCGVDESGDGESKESSYVLLNQHNEQKDAKTPQREEGNRIVVIILCMFVTMSDPFHIT